MFLRRLHFSTSNRVFFPRFHISGSDRFRFSRPQNIIASLFNRENAIGDFRRHVSCFLENDTGNKYYILIHQIIHIMKAIVLSVAVFLGAAAYANASFSNAGNTERAAVAVQQCSGYAEVKFADLSETVREAVKNYGPEYAVKNLAYNSDRKLTRVTFVSKNDQSEKVVILNEEGKEVK